MSAQRPRSLRSECNNVSLIPVTSNAQAEELLRRLRQRPPGIHVHRLSKAAARRLGSPCDGTTILVPLEAVSSSLTIVTTPTIYSMPCTRHSAALPPVPL